MKIASRIAAGTLGLAAATGIALGAAGAAHAGTMPITRPGEPTVAMTITNHTNKPEYLIGSNADGGQWVNAPQKVLYPGASETITAVAPFNNHLDVNAMYRIGAFGPHRQLPAHQPQVQRQHRNERDLGGTAVPAVLDEQPHRHRLPAGQCRIRPVVSGGRLLITGKHSGRNRKVAGPECFRGGSTQFMGGKMFSSEPKAPPAPVAAKFVVQPLNETLSTFTLPAGVAAGGWLEMP